MVRRSRPRAQILGVPAIRIDAVPAKLARAEFLKQAIETLKRILAATEATGVSFAVENHSNTTNDPAFLAALFEGVGSKRLGLTLDTANFYWFGHPLSKVYELCKTFAPNVRHTHCKNIRYPVSEREKHRPMGWKYAEYGCPVGEGDIDFGRIAKLLYKAGYHNDLCVEDEFLGTLSAAAATRRLAKQIESLNAHSSGGFVILGQFQGDNTKPLADWPHRKTKGDILLFLLLK